MVVQLPGGVFTLRFWPTILTLVMLAVLIGLGTWQVERLHWKQNLLAEIDQRSHMPPVDISNLTDASNIDYLPAKASGLFRHDQEFYLTAISKDGQGGYHVLTPLQLDNGTVLLVDRGWVPYDKKDPATRRDGQLFGPVSVTGLLRKPIHIWSQPANDPAHNQWYGIDLAAMAAQANMPAFLPYVLDADATPNAGGYPIGGQTRVTLPNNHLSYAMTWFGLALALLVIYGVSGYRKVS